MRKIKKCAIHLISYNKRDCPECKKIWDHTYYINNKSKINKTNKKYVEENKEKIAAYKALYYIDHKDEKKEYDEIYRKTHNSRIKEYTNEWHKNKYESDISFKLSKVISANIRGILFRNNISKNKVSCFEKLNYSVQELKIYLENKFDSWMNWHNYGLYNKNSWDDNDPSTWTWNIDHIIPQSDLFYISMDDDNFKKCWALENLRPYSAKQNCLDGSSRKRHAK